MMIIAGDQVRAPVPEDEPETGVRDGGYDSPSPLSGPRPGAPLQIVGRAFIYPGNTDLLVIRSTAKCRPCIILPPRFDEELHFHHERRGACTLSRCRWRSSSPRLHVAAFGTEPRTKRSQGGYTWTRTAGLVKSNASTALLLSAHRPSLGIEKPTPLSDCS